jgi:hypothetical protein
MKIMLRAAIAAVSIGTIGSAYAGNGEGAAGNTLFTEVPAVVDQAPVRNAPLAATGQNGPAHVSGSDRTTWMVPPIGKYIAQ